MPMSVVYTTVNGQILCENRGGVVSHFVSDPLGSVVMVRDNAGNTVYEAEYDPYGNVQSETGTNPSEFGYVGTLGYVKDSVFSLYVRARYLLTNLGRWLTKDPLWPSEPGFVYAGAAPSMWVDPSGDRHSSCEPVFKDCPQAHKVRNAYASFRGRMLKMCRDPNLIQKFKDCMKKRGYRDSDISNLSKCVCDLAEQKKPITFFCVSHAECSKRGEDCMFAGVGGDCGIRVCPECPYSAFDMGRGISHEVFHCCGATHGTSGTVHTGDADACLRHAIGWGWGAIR